MSRFSATKGVVKIARREDDVLGGIALVFGLLVLVMGGSLLLSLSGPERPVNRPLLIGTLAVVTPLFAVWYLRGRLPPVVIDLGANRISVADGATLDFAEIAVVRLRVVNTEHVRTDSDGDAASSRRIERTVWVEGSDRRIAVLEAVNRDPGVREFAADLARRIGVPLTEEYERD